jgi:cysteine-rich repeat protein
VAASITKNGGPARGYDSYAFPGYWGDFALAMTACGMNNPNATNQSVYFAYANDSIEAFLSAADWTTSSNAPRQPDGRQGKWSNITTGTSSDLPQYICQQACVGGNEDADSIRWPKLCTAYGFAAQNGITINPHVAEYCGDYVNASAHQSTSCPVQWSTAGGALSSVGLGYKQNGLCAYGDFSSETSNWLTRMVATGNAKWSTSNLWYNDNTGQAGGTPCFGIYWGEFIVTAHGYGIGYADSTFNLSLGNGSSNATAVCGNGNIESGEQCDDGNTLSGDGCSATCQTEVGAKGLVSTVVGATPFYTNRSNPQTGANVSCLYNMVGNTSCNVTWYVNATGTAGTSWNFFAYAVSTVNSTVAREGTTQNISIRDATAPIITNVTNRSITSSSVVIAWNTDELANATVAYNTSSTVLKNLSGSSSLALWRQITLSGLAANTTYYYNVTSCDNSTFGAKNCNTTGPYNFTTLGSASNVTMNISTTQIVELGTVTSVMANNSAGASVCIDIDHPSYGTNYACGSGSVTVNITPTYFRKTKLNDSTVAKNLTFAGAGNQTVYVRLHVLDELRGLLLNVTGFSNGGLYPNGVVLYAGRNASNTIGLLLNSTRGSVTAFSDASTEKNVTFTTASTQVAGYLYLPKQADVTSATFSFRGTDDFTYQENANSTYAAPTFNTTTNESYLYINYSKVSGTSNNSLWQVKYGTGATTTATNMTNLSVSCWGADANVLQFRFAVRTVTAYQGYTALTRQAMLQCYDGSAWQNLTNTTVANPSATNPYGPGYDACLYDPPYQNYLGYEYNVFAIDGNYLTYAFYSYPSTDDPIPAGWCYRKAGLGLPSIGSIGLLYEEGMFWSLAPTSPFMEAGFINGSRDWNYSGYFNTSAVSSNASGKINTFLDACTADSQGYCLVPIYVYSQGGRLSIFNVSVNFTYDVNPVNVSVPGLEAYVSSNNTTGFVDVPLTFYSAQAGIIQVNDIKLDYVGGNSTINVTAHNDAYTSTRNVSIIAHHSRWNYSLPQNVRSFEFVPQTPSSKQVPPRGQSSTKPFLNITSLAYSQPFNFSVFVNESYSCVNLSWSGVGNYSTAVPTNGTWTSFITNLSLRNSSGIWVWADYACNFTTWRAWRPNVSLRACAVGSRCDEGR